MIKYKITKVEVKESVINFTIHKNNKVIAELFIDGANNSIMEFDTEYLKSKYKQKIINQLIKINLIDRKDKFLDNDFIVINL